MSRSRIQYLILLVFVISAPSFADLFESKIPASAKRPFFVPGTIAYKTFSNVKGAPTRRVHNCVLLHGHGFSQQILDFLKENDGRKIAELSPLPVEVNPQAAQLMPPKLKEISSADATTLVAYFYYGKEFIDRLLAQACDNVIVPIQESNQSTHMELVLRTERFLKRVACTSANNNKQWGCAAVGHSKLGGVLTSIVRRCMGALSLEKGGSELGQFGCANLGKVYSAAGVNEGVGATVALLGAKTLREQYNEKKDAMDSFLKLADTFMNASAQVEEGMKHYQLLQNVESRFGLDIIGDYIKGETNPLWLDLSPIAATEDGVPLLVRNRDFVPLKQGWFQGSYAASATNFDLSTGEKLSCGTTAKPQKIIPGGVNLPLPRGGLLAPPPPPPPAGAPGAPAAGKRPLLDALRGAVRNGVQNGKTPILDFIRDPLLTLHDQVCDQFNTKIGELHEPKVQPLFLAGLGAMKKVAKAEHLTAADGTVDFLNAVTWEKFNHSDGLVDYSLSMDVCERGKAIVDKTKQAVISCTTFKDINHLQYSGTAFEVADDIVAVLTR